MWTWNRNQVGVKHLAVLLRGLRSRRNILLLRSIPRARSDQGKRKERKASLSDKFQLVGQHTRQWALVAPSPRPRKGRGMFSRGMRVYVFSMDYLSIWIFLFGSVFSGVRCAMDQVNWRKSRTGKKEYEWWIGCPALHDIKYHPWNGAYRNWSNWLNSLTQTAHHPSSSPQTSSRPSKPAQRYVIDWLHLHLHTEMRLTREKNK